MGFLEGRILSISWFEFVSSIWNYKGHPIKSLSSSTRVVFWHASRSANGLGMRWLCKRWIGLFVWLVLLCFFCCVRYGIMLLYLHFFARLASFVLAVSAFFSYQYNLHVPSQKLKKSCNPWFRPFVVGWWVGDIVGTCKQSTNNRRESGV